MFHRSALVLALVSSLIGCMTAPPKAPLVEYREGLTTTTRKVRREANYELRTVGEPEVRLTGHRVSKGERLGFQSEPNGGVSAVGAGEVVRLGPGAYAWVEVPGTATTWRKRVWRDSQEPLRTVGEGMRDTVCNSVALALSLSLWAAYDQGGGPSCELPGLPFPPW